ncbi:MAG: hypothetical protein L0Z70_12285 [Chloroflexi bacterium]|nr:hypothetical protein [Chloroflexota bacterium]
MSLADVQIESLHARVLGPAPPEETSTLAARLAAMLARADLRPPGLPPSAVLLVCRLPAAALPPLAPWGYTLGPGLAWETAARNALAGCLRRAVRPQRGRIPADAEAVIFADEAEWLACLALDLSAGRALPPWRQPPRPLALADLLIQEARLLPALAALWQAWGCAHEVVQALTPHDARRVLQALIHAYSLPPLPASLKEDEPEGGLSPAQAALEQPGRSPQAQRGQPPASAAQPPPGGAPSALPPWRLRWDLPAFAPRRLGWERAALLGVSLALRRSPALGQDAAFWRDFHRWQAAEAAHAGAEETARALPAETDVQGYSLLQAGVQDALPGAFSPPEAALPGAAASVEQGGLPSPVQEAAPRADTQALHTLLGGVFYLIPLFQALDLPECCEPGWRLASGIGRWGLLETVACGLLDGGAEYDHDPLWHALAALDGREPSEQSERSEVGEIGAGVQDGGEFRPPPRWLIPLDVVLPPAEFQSPWFAALNPALRRWLALALPYVRFRLLASLRSLPGVAEGGLTNALLARPARITIEPAHVDVIFSLGDISLPVRAAGLDRDPGWLPAYGRVIRFHYL